MQYALLFPGQGSQCIGMGKSFYESHTLAKELFEKASGVLKVDMKKLLFEENELLKESAYTQPAIYLVSHIAYELLNKHVDGGLKPAFALGHSLGEVSAVSLSGALDFDKAIKLTHQRGKMMQEVCVGKDVSMMVVLGVSEEKLLSLCQKTKNVWCANFNGGMQVVLAGLKNDLKALEPTLKEMGAKRVVFLEMSVASHCPFLEPMVFKFQELLEKHLKDKFNFEIISNATKEAYNNKEKAIELLSLQLTQPVCYQDCVKSNNDRVDAFFELGCGSVLKGLNKRLSNKPTISVGDNKGLEEAIEFLEEYV
ncbi:ACP S-malonyltransferase [Helicobacter cetorum]|uniref:Malonyl CoA-acyl carrier protein transacylase n=1 Tax=Helicobacter cetorum (strain ATCC BAA-540 / CCUG 52418 / MIT 99-5656) TaxID=1163745 RepID=I0ERZ8_HELCM|nr:ACP S-malonyltransferase [Helicobacter cetorum]AFI05717.1 malonyl CoA-acyl carrier protein transacylase [Helicobacter cetorum MIT 99-5656]